MPELPEVETVVRDIRPQIKGRLIAKVWVNEPGILRYPNKKVFKKELKGLFVKDVHRKGKYIFLNLAENETVLVSKILIIHLGMTGRLLLNEPEEIVKKHTHLRLWLSSGLELRMEDPRRFGRLILGTEQELKEKGLMPEVGPEPFGESLTLDQFSKIIKSSKRPLKALLLDQKKIAGLGNIYTDESCYRANVLPNRYADSLSEDEISGLYQAMYYVLEKSVSLRGSSIDDYRDGFGNKGANQDVLQVYARTGRPCFVCGTLLSGIKLAGRTTVYCSSCHN